ncbi:predicted protein [Chaetomium globosum CBS 148.51]|uniref:Uncharacterized protein n=1 Tax=Chaetomium globosum (strain ATCC 6205 / CBS 148.51 / DSM 1962 / NBRC 6347 / NRRL 1970) TaxID=306901 RepID=Q2H1R3_CHAGB|nr:uncharacterized protein CHGG_04283 [Chaetomium globosum CBS 148.51]EAQ87664.1 predicted protein [Chaetomium globosum CBS 148.51]
MADGARPWKKPGGLLRLLLCAALTLPLFDRCQ